jgi:prepilin-type N-terminal cleavage/methylation domain-containing protein
MDPVRTGGRLRDKRAGFTLIEIALAVAVFAVAIVAILGLFPVGLRNASDSRVESVVVQVARGIFSGLRASKFTEARVYTSPPDERGVMRFVTVNLASPGPPIYVLYGTDGAIVRQVQQSEYAMGMQDGDCIAKVETAPATAVNPAVVRVSVTVEHPAAAATERRNKFVIVTSLAECQQ